MGASSPAAGRWWSGPVELGPALCLFIASPAATAAAALLPDIVDNEPPRLAALSSAESLSPSFNIRVGTPGVGQPDHPDHVGDPAGAVALSCALRARLFFLPAIRPPTVPDGESLLRVSLTAGHTEEMISRLLAALVGSAAGCGV